MMTLQEEMGETPSERVLSELQEEPFCSEAEQPDPAGSRNDHGEQRF